MGDLNALPGLQVVVAHNPVGPDDDLSTADVLEQVATVEQALAVLGVASSRVCVAAGRPWEVLAPETGRVIFNLVESPPGQPHLGPASTAALEALGLPFTGASAAVLQLTTDKLVTRAVLQAAGLPVAPGGRLDLDRLEAPILFDSIPPPWIVKPACEDASLGLEGDPVSSDRETILALARTLARRFPGQGIVLEHYLPGREFNVALLADPAHPEGVQVLPIAEMTFVGYAEGQPKVVSYEAKWVEGTFGWEHTTRRFPDPRKEKELLAKIEALVRSAWKVCGVAGYARVDLRLDEAGTPRILEVNANPCLVPEVGLLAAAEAAGLKVEAVIERIVQDALRRRPLPLSIEAPSAPPPAVPLRGLRRSDRPALAAMIEATGFFNPEEVALALELIDDRLAHGDESHYRFLVAEVEGAAAGYLCWGAIPGTRASADLYWIVVAPRFQGKGIGRALLAAGEAALRREGRCRIYVETSTRPQYEPTRGFYQSSGYHLAAELADFYAPGDGKAVYVKVL